MGKIKDFLDNIRVWINYKIHSVWVFNPNLIRLRWYRLTCRKWDKCVLLTWDMEFPLCNNDKCPLVKHVAGPRAYKKTIGTYVKAEDPAYKDKKE